MKSIRSAVSLAGVTAARGSMLSRCRSNAGVLGGALVLGDIVPSLTFFALLPPVEEDRGSDGVEPNSPFSVTNGNTGAGLWLGPVDRMKSAKSLDDSI